MTGTGTLNSIETLIAALTARAEGHDAAAAKLRTNGMFESARGERLRAETLRQVIAEMQEQLL